MLKVDPGLADADPIGTAAPGDQGTVIVYRDDAPVELPAGSATTRQHPHRRHLRRGQAPAPGVRADVDIRAGDSGAVVVVDDKAVALVWATSRLAEGRAWAMRTSLIADHLAHDTGSTTASAPDARAA